MLKSICATIAFCGALMANAQLEDKLYERTRTLLWEARDTIEDANQLLDPAPRLALAAALMVPKMIETLPLVGVTPDILGRYSLKDPENGVLAWLAKQTNARTPSEKSFNVSEISNGIDKILDFKTTLGLNPFTLTTQTYNLVRHYFEREPENAKAKDLDRLFFQSLGKSNGDHGISLVGRMFLSFSEAYSHLFYRYEASLTPEEKSRKRISFIEKKLIEEREEETEQRAYLQADELVARRSLLEKFKSETFAKELESYERAIRLRAERAERRRAFFEEEVELRVGLEEEEIATRKQIPDLFKQRLRTDLEARELAARERIFALFEAERISEPFEAGKNAIYAEREEAKEAERKRIAAESKIREQRQLLELEARREKEPLRKEEEKQRNLLEKWIRARVAIALCLEKELKIRDKIAHESFETLPALYILPYLCHKSYPTLEKDIETTKKLEVGKVTFWGNAKAIAMKGKITAAEEAIYTNCRFFYALKSKTVEETKNMDSAHALALDRLALEKPDLKPQAKLLKAMYEIIRESTPSSWFAPFAPPSEISEILWNGIREMYVVGQLLERERMER